MGGGRGTSYQGSKRRNQGGGVLHIKGVNDETRGGASYKGIQVAAQHEGDDVYNLCNETEAIILNLSKSGKN